MAEPKKNFERRLDRAQLIREAYVDQLTTDETRPDEIAMPADEKERLLLMQILRDIDNSELKRRKLDIEADDADTNRMVAQMVIEATRQSAGQDPFRRAADGSAAPVTSDEKLGQYEFQEGEKLQGTHIESVAEFEQREGKI